MRKGQLRLLMIMDIPSGLRDRFYGKRSVRGMPAVRHLLDGLKSSAFRTEILTVDTGPAADIVRKEGPLTFRIWRRPFPSAVVRRMAFFRILGREAEKIIRRERPSLLCGLQYGAVITGRLGRRFSLPVVHRIFGTEVNPPVGEANEVFLVSGWKGSIYLLTTDGLFLTELFGDLRKFPLWRM